MVGGFAIALTAIVATVNVLGSRIGDVREELRDLRSDQNVLDPAGAREQRQMSCPGPLGIRHSRVTRSYLVGSARRSFLGTTMAMLRAYREAKSSATPRHAAEVTVAPWCQETILVGSSSSTPTGP